MLKKKKKNGGGGGGGGQVRGQYNCKRARWVSVAPRLQQHEDFLGSGQASKRYR